MHHIICDGTTMMIIMNELNKYYNEEEVEKLDIQYSDYAIHLKEKKINGKLNEQIEVYKEIFSNEYEILNIPTKNNGLNNNEYNVKEENHYEEFNESNKIEEIIDNSTSERINEFIRHHNISKTALFISIYGYVLSKYSGQDTIYTSMMSANRNNHYVENMAGMFVSTLPLLLKYNNEENRFIEIIKENMEMLNNIYKNQDISFAELTEILKLKKMNNSFIFQPNISNRNDGNQDKSIFSSLEENEIMKLKLLSGIENILKNNNKSKFDITFNVIESENNYKIYIEYNNSLYDTMVIKQMVDSYIEIMKNISNLENSDIRNIEYIPMEQKERIIKEFNSDVNKEVCEKLYHEEFQKMAQQYPERYAIVFNEEKITYKELDEMSNSLAYYLRSEGVKRNDIIPIICDRSPYYIIGILGISKAGGAFLPIDKDLPDERIQFILGEVNSKVILFSNCKEVIDTLKNNEDNIEYNIYDLVKHDYSSNYKEINNINEPDDICYVLFTSGTTGKPKGTLINHFNICNYIRKFKYSKNNNYCLYELLNVSSIKNILAITNFSFDMSHNEIIFTLYHGMKIVLVDDNIYNDALLLSNYIINNNVEFIKITPTRIKYLFENIKFREAMKFIKCIILGGESVSLNLCENIYTYSNCNIFNEYGPTECSVACSTKKIDLNINNKINIGKPYCNCKIYILDKYKKPVPIGIVGEIYIGGYGVGKGYLNRPELTKEKFVENPFNFDGDKYNRIMYRTGDLGRWTMEGEIEYLGRIDFQVKINGQRVELGEIESKILEMPEVQQCVVIDKMKENGEKYLVCYYTTDKNGKEISNKSIREYLGTKLPRYMVPNYYIRINEIPLSSTGKLNRRGLPEPKKEDLITEIYEAPVNEIEKVICKIYNEVFKIPGVKIGRMHDFYKLGGNSLNAIRVSSRIEKELKIKIYIKDIMSHSKICDLSKYIESIMNDEKSDRNKMEIISRYNKKEFPITSQQLGVYLDSIKEPNSLIYNVPNIYKLNENTDKEKIKKSFLKIFDGQEILRSKYYGKEINGKTEIYGYIDDECTLKFEEYSYENIGGFIRPFELDKAPLMRVGFINDEILLIDMHHIICDGSTDLIIMNELNKYYNDEEIEELEIQYSDYAIHLNEKKNNGKLNEQIEVYKEIFSNEYEMLNIPTKNNISNNEYNVKEENYKEEFNESNKIEILVDKSTSEMINEFIKHHNISKTAFFMSIYGYVLSKYSGQDIIYTSMMSAN
eukprot:jgi/Orpsp1_1/1187701/evm.model.d7180000059555.1